MNSSTVWLLKKGSEKKFRTGHPWVFSNELAQSPKGLPPGGLVELRDFSGRFLAWGYGHPNSLISFRRLALEESTRFNAEFFASRLKSAAEIRTLSGVSEFSHRLCFAEGDDLPGLIIDRYRLVDEQRAGTGQVFVIQCSTAGMDQLLPLVIQGLEIFVKSEGISQEQGEEFWLTTSVVLANDSKSRLMEGLDVIPKKVIRQADQFDATSARILVQPPLPDLKPTIFKVDFIGGQKTGFFLDQRMNVHLAAQAIDQMAREAAKEGRTLRILDLFCYVGQWGSQLANLISSRGAKVEVTLVDASLKALEMAGSNVEENTHNRKENDRIVVLEKRDVVDELSLFEKKAYDIVICDPPAFVKKKKDLPTGTQAYFKVNREAIQKVKSKGLFVSCSCSGLFDENEFRTMLARVDSTFGGQIRWIARGGHSVDHPQKPEFPQGTYLKSWMGIIG